MTSSYPQDMREKSPDGMPWALVRRSRRLTDNLLLNDTQAWLAALPEDVKPILLPLDFPRLANELVLVWPDRAAAAARLQELLTDERGNRQGFPPLVHQEIERLLEIVLGR